jgi:hypothetical protein
MMLAVFCGSDELPAGCASHDDHCAGFLAHAMAPMVRVNINLAIQDSVADYTLLRQLQQWGPPAVKKVQAIQVARQSK